jgi:glycosyltransferase involved in cell wall biosynthesis
MFCAFYHPYVGGAEVFAQEIAKRLVKKGNKVSVITGKWDRKLKNFEVIDGVNVYRTPVAHVKNIRLLSYVPLAVKKGIEVAKDADVLHANLGFSAGFAAALVKKATGKPLVITVQGGDLGDYAETTGKFGGAVVPLIRWGLKNADVVHAISNHTAILARKLGAKRVEIAPLGIDPAKFNTRLNSSGVIKKYGLRGNPLIVSVSRLSPKNGLVYLIKAMPAVLKAAPNARLVIAGEGEQLGELKQLITSLGLWSSVQLLGKVPHSDVPYLTRAADIFVRTSIDEGFGVAFVEALACGVPAIGTDVGGIPDIIRNNETGILVKPKESEGISKAILRLHRDKKLGTKVIRNGLKEVKERFLWDEITNKILGMYSIAGR